MRTFEQMSIPDLEITKEGYAAVKQIEHQKLQELERQICHESIIKPVIDKFTRENELEQIIEAEIFNQKQDK